MIKALPTFLERDEGMILRYAPSGLATLAWAKLQKLSSAVEVAFAARKLIGLMMDAMATATRGDQAIVGELAVDVHIAFFPTRSQR